MDITLINANNHFYNYEKSNAEIQLRQPEKTISFTGYRLEKLPEHGSTRIQENLCQLLQNATINSLDRGYTTFINGCMAGWDILAAETVLKLKSAHPEIICVTVAPFRQGFLTGPSWPPGWKKRALHVYQQSDLAFSLSERYEKGIYYKRDRFLIDHCSLVICYFDGKPGGTKYTLDYAAAQNKTIINLAESGVIKRNEN